MPPTLQDSKMLYLTYAKGLELFSKKGYHNTSLEDICTYLSISKEAFQHSFISKEDFFINIAQNVILRSTFELLIEPLSYRQSPFPLVLDRIELELEKAVNSTDDKGFLLGNFITEFNKRNTRINKCLLDILKTWQINLTALFKKGQLDNYVNKGVDCEAVAQYITSSYMGVRIQMVEGNSRLLANQYLNQLRYYFYSISRNFRV